MKNKNTEDLEDMKFAKLNKRDDDTYYNDGYDEYSGYGEYSVDDAKEDADDDMSVVPEKEEKKEAVSGFGGIDESAVSLKIMAPRDFAEATKVADSLVAGSTVVLNIEQLDRDEMIRFVDFLMGVIYVINGSMKNVSKTTLVVSPSSIGVESEGSAE